MKTRPSAAADKQITDRFIATVRARLKANKRVRRILPGWGRLHIDRQLPFMCVYRQFAEGQDSGTEKLVTGEASYLIASDAGRPHDGISRLIKAVAQTLHEEFGGFLLLEIWSTAFEPSADSGAATKLIPRFRIAVPRDQEMGGFLDSLDQALSRIRIRRQKAEVEIEHVARCCPGEGRPLLSASEREQIGCNLVGLEVEAIYRDPSSGSLYPQLLRELSRQLSRALHQTLFDFVRTHTTHRPEHYHMLGRRAVVKAVWEVDRRLAEVSDSFDSLLQVTPVNAEVAWREFQRRRFEREPVFRYRPLPVDPITLKRRLYHAPVERVEDPALQQLFRQKQDELDRRITLLTDINTPRFVHGSIQLYGGVDDPLSQLARSILDQIPSRTRDDTKSGHLSAAEFADRARKEIKHYRDQWPEMDAQVQLRDDIVSGLMVSRDTLLVSTNIRIPARRADALLQHEVGTHLVTYYNGRAQPFRQLYAGLAGYDALQEGLAVLAEYLVGGLSRPRLRLLAARVAATRHMLEGASFVETYRELDRTYDFDQRTAFTVTMRIYRGGGLTKDAVYLKGLCQLMEYLSKGGELGALFCGKIAINHIPIIRELRWRQVLRPDPLRPRYLDMPEAADRLNRVEGGLRVQDLIAGAS